MSSSTPRRGRLSRIVAVLSAAVVVCTTVPLSAHAQDAEQSALSNARARIEQVATQLAAARDEQESAEAALADAERYVAEVEAAVNEAAAALDRQEIVVAAASDRLAALAAEAAALEEVFAVRAASLYKRGGTASFEVLLRAASIEEFIDRTDLMAVVAAADRGKFQRAVNTRSSLAAQRRVERAEVERLAAMKTEQEALLAQAAVLREDRFLTAAVARSEVETLEQMHADLEEDSRRLASVIRSLQAPPTSVVPATAVAPPSSGGGGYAWPLCAPVSSEFGWRWGRRHEGVDIDGNTGDAIYASRAGVVISNGFQGGYGRLLLIDHGNGVVTAYAHLSSVSVGVGQAVGMGTYVAAVGATGNATGSHLHFETRVNGNAVDPRQLLSGGC